MFGEKEGEDSPSFHTLKKEDIQKFLWQAAPECALFLYEDWGEFSTFFHDKRRSDTLKRAEKELLKHKENAQKANYHIKELSQALGNLATQLSNAPKLSPLSPTCAALAEVISQAMSKIHTNILKPIEILLSSLFDESTFLQIKKELIFCEAAEIVLCAISKPYEKTSEVRPLSPPSHIRVRLSEALQHYEEGEKLIFSLFPDAAKAAKEENKEKYSNILHNIITGLFDRAALIDACRAEQE